MSGIEVLSRIKERSKETEVIIITGHGGTETAIEAMKGGAFGYIQKPIEYDELEIEIKRALEKQEMKRKLDEDILNLERSVKEKTEELSRRKEAEEALRESEKKFRTLFNTSPHAIALTEMKTGKLVDVNEKFCQLTRNTKNEIIGRTTTQLGFYSEDDRNRFVNELTNSGKVDGLEMDFKAKDGSTLNARMFAIPIQIEKEVFVLTEFHDVTEQKRLEAQLQQAQKVEAIGTLAGGIAHDFNNILGAIIGHAELAKMDVPEESEVYGNLDQVLKAGTRAAKLVKQILTVSRQHQQEQRPVQIRYIVQEALKLIRATLPTTIEIKEDLVKESGIINADPTQMHQVIMNLCINAGHAMQEDGGVLTVVLANVESDDIAAAKDLDVVAGSYVRLTVSDTGHGMRPEIMDRIFDPYFTTKGIGEGTGLGLSVVQGIVKAHGGAITVYSQPEKGTTFHVYLPVVLEEEREKKESKEPLPPEASVSCSLMMSRPW